MKRNTKNILDNMETSSIRYNERKYEYEKRCISYIKDILNIYKYMYGQDKRDE